MTKPSNQPVDFDTLLDQSMEELQLKTQAHDETWHLGEADWNLDQEVGDLIFTTPNGPVATCKAQIIGTYNTLNETWLWSWANSSINPELQRDALALKAFGQQNGIEPLMMDKVGCDELQAWELTALACKLCEAQGAYRGPAGDTMVFMTFSDVKLNKA